MWALGFLVILSLAPGIGGWLVLAWSVKPDHAGEPGG